MHDRQGQPEPKRSAICDVVFRAGRIARKTGSLRTLKKKERKTMPYIYILHFGTKLAHAEHYTGCTADLRTRLIRHANGDAARLTQVLIEEGIEWRLGGLMETSVRNMRRLERHLKDQHNAWKYCEICSQPPMAMKGCKPWPVGLVPFEATSQALRGIAVYQLRPHVRPISAGDGPEVMEQVRKLMRKDKDALGYIPAGGSQGLQLLVSRGQIMLAEMADVVIGYAAYTVSRHNDLINIHQCCVADEYRLGGTGTKLVGAVGEKHAGIEMCCKVRSDLAANHFWEAIGFECVGSVAHKTSGNVLNHYRAKNKRRKG